MTDVNFDYLRHVIRARLFLAVRMRARAIAEYREALRFEPHAPKALSALAYLMFQENRLPEAERLFLAALESNPRDAIAWFNLGFVRDKQRRLAEAVEAFQKAVELKPTIDRAWYGMGIAHAALGAHDQAAIALERAAELQPMNPHAWYNLGMAYHTLHRPEKVTEVIKHLHRFDPKMSRQLILDAERADLAHLIGT